MANMSANFDEVAHSGLVSIMFTSILPYMSIVTLTFDLQNQYGSDSNWEDKVPCAIVPLTWKMAHQSLCRMIRNGPFKIIEKS